MPDQPIAGIVLAAGASRRMGPGQNKLLLELGGEPLVRRAAQTALAAGLAPVVVVLGFQADRARRALGTLECDPVVNPSFQGPMSASLHTGLRRVPQSAKGAVVLLADMPRVTPDMIGALRGAVRHGGWAIVASRYGGVIAPPVLFSRSVFPELESWTGDGFKAIVQRHGERVQFIDWPARALADIDTPGDLQPQPGITQDH